jgi:hypothetical protein
LKKSPCQYDHSMDDGCPPYKRSQTQIRADGKQAPGSVERSSFGSSQGQVSDPQVGRTNNDGPMYTANETTNSAQNRPSLPTDYGLGMNLDLDLDLDMNLDVELDKKMTANYSHPGASNSATKAPMNGDILPDLALSPNSYEALTSLLQSMAEVDNAGMGPSTQTQTQTQTETQMGMQMQMQMQMSMGNTPLPNALNFPFDFLPTYGNSSYAGPVNGQTDLTARPSDNFGTDIDMDPKTVPGESWFFEKPLRLLGDGSDPFEANHDPAIGPVEMEGRTSFTPSGFGLVTDQAQRAVEDASPLLVRRRIDIGGNNGGNGNGSMDAFRLPTSFRSGSVSDPTSGPVSGSGSGSGSGSAGPSPGSIINLSSLSPGAGQTSTLIAAPTSEEIPLIFRERLLGSFMKQGRRFGLIYHWPTFWERMRGEESLRPHPAWINAMVSRDCCVSTPSLPTPELTRSSLDLRLAVHHRSSRFRRPSPAQDGKTLCPTRRGTLQFGVARV